MQHKGVIAQVLGPVVDVQFEAGALPQLNEELVVEKPDGRRTMEVAREIGRQAGRCILVSPGGGLGRRDTVIAHGHPTPAPPPTRRMRASCSGVAVKKGGVQRSLMGSPASCMARFIIGMKGVPMS